jgi:ABC-type nitrate/sulfonate/bicarbonate transport system ATPase subunit
LLEFADIEIQRGGRTIVSGLSFNLAAGQMLCLTGPSGIGKTTVMEIAAGLLSPDQGQRCFQKGRLAYAFQDDALIPWRTVSQNLEFVLDNGRDTTAANWTIAKWLRRLGLENAAEKYPAEISGGMRRRLNLARAFSLEADLLILDEPFAFLDERWLQHITLYLSKELERGAAILLASHQMEPLAGFAYRSLDIQYLHGKKAGRRESKPVALHSPNDKHSLSAAFGRENYSEP